MNTEMTNAVEANESSDWSATRSCKEKRQRFASVTDLDLDLTSPSRKSLGPKIQEQNTAAFPKWLSKNRANAGVSMVRRPHARLLEV